MKILVDIVEIRNSQKCLPKFQEKDIALRLEFTIKFVNNNIKQNQPFKPKYLNLISRHFKSHEILFLLTEIKLCCNLQEMFQTFPCSTFYKECYFTNFLCKEFFHKIQEFII